MTQRIEVIREMLGENPDDVFLHYSLGMEYVSAGQHAQAVAEFRKCIDLDAAHLPAHVELGKCLRSAGRLEEARGAFASAMELAAAQGERHVCDFVQQQLDALAPS